MSSHFPALDLASGISPPPGKEARDRQRLDRMTIAAFELFADSGFSKTRIETICKTANVSTRDFYTLAKTKEFLLLRVYRKIVSHVEACVTQTLADNAAADFKTRLDKAISCWVEVYTKDPRTTRIGYIETVGVSEEIELARRASHNSMAAIIEAEFAASGTPLPGKLALAIVGAANELVLDWLSQTPLPDSGGLRQEILLVYNTLLTGLGENRK
jgi:AcrR family transcriptional regulator